MNLKPLAFPVIFTLFYGITCLVAYGNGDHDGRIQQRRVDAEEWKTYIDKDQEWQACADRIWASPKGYVSQSMRVKTECGELPREPKW